MRIIQLLNAVRQQGAAAPPVAPAAPAATPAVSAAAPAPPVAPPPPVLAPPPCVAPAAANPFPQTPPQPAWPVWWMQWTRKCLACGQMSYIRNQCCLNPHCVSLHAVLSSPDKSSGFPFHGRFAHGVFSQTRMPWAPPHRNEFRYAAVSVFLRRDSPTRGTPSFLAGSTGNVRS